MISFRASRVPRFGRPRPQIRPYAVKIPPGECQKDIKTVAELKAWGPSSHVPDVEVCGWVRSVRKSSGVRFIDITDGSSMRPVQVVVDKNLATDMRPGAAVRLKGTWVDESRKQSAINGTSQASSKGETSTGSEQPELKVSEVEVLGGSDPMTYPIQNKYQTPESLRTISHLRPRTPLNSTMLRFRSDATTMLTQFFFRERFQQTHPPIITSSDCEGAGEAFSVKASSADEFFRDPKYLTVSSQLHLEALAQALGNVWTLSPTFRAEQSDTSRHLSEFYMLEAEMSFVGDMEEVMNLTQRMLNSMATGLKELNAAKELEQNRVDSKEPSERLAFNDLVDQEQLDRRWRGMLTTKKWPRITYSEALEILKPIAEQFEHKPTWGSGLQSEHEKYLAEKIGYDEATDAYVPIFITQYPRDIKAFYMRQSSSSPASGLTVDCFDLLVPHLGELAGGSMREHRLPQLEENMRALGLEVPSKRSDKGKELAWYLDLRRWGCPPHGGFGLGFDRLLSYLTGVPNVRDVVPFPRHYHRCDC
ncbi:related to asn-tRNA synthetase, mitochondrial [Fusarium proliferatum]|nr:asparaginyl-tRNA synthetase [Fusarium proliferatum]CVK98184.1 related to asn-tRNA synthetase, mitochondrial [Fusarium proliferatum]